MSAGDDKLIYVAAPYTHADPAVRNERVLEATKYAAYLIDQGEPVFSPLSHSVEIERHRQNIDSPRRWYDIDLQILQVCTHMHILGLDGWELSQGIQYEIAAAAKRELPITVVVGLAIGAYHMTDYVYSEADKNLSGC